ncbi:PP0621 family protein [Chitinivorax sp. PXF-14]|uniref:PP0621 family protein n=1 Tax=Chitinivorax sp. PXF-14 TaxID=3230488 RepID=UPI0034677456
MLLRIIALLIIGYLIWRWLRQRPPLDTPPEAVPHQLLRCAQCGTFVPESEVVRDGQRTFCCADHRDKFKLTSDN